MSPDVVHTKHQGVATLSTPKGTGPVAPTDVTEQPTPTDAAGLPTPLGTIGCAALPPTPFVPQSTAGPAAANAQSFAWRGRAYNATFRGRSPSSSRYVYVMACLC